MFERQVKWRDHKELKAAFVAERKQRAADREARRARAVAEEAKSNNQDYWRRAQAANQVSQPVRCSVSQLIS